MLIKKPDDLKSSEITDKSTYLNRRLFIRAAVLAGTATATTIAYRKLNPPPVVQKETETLNAVSSNEPQALANGFRTDEKLPPTETLQGLVTKFLAA